MKRAAQSPKTGSGKSSSVVPTPKKRRNNTENDQDYDTHAITAVRSSYGNESKLLNEVGRRLGYDDVRTIADAVESFLRPLSNLIPELDGDNLQTILETDFTAPAPGSLTYGIEEAIDLSGSWKFHVSCPNSSKCSLYFTKSGRNEIEIPTIESIFEALGSITGASLNVDLPDIIGDTVGTLGATVQNLQLSFFSNLFPSISMDMVYAFDQESSLSMNLGLKEIRLSTKIDFHLRGSIALQNTLSLGIGEIRVIALMPEERNDPWIFALDTTQNGVTTLANLLRTVKLGDLTNTGIYSLTDSDDGAVSIVSLVIGIGNHGIEFFTIGVESNFSADLGKVEFSNPAAFLELSEPFNSQNRSTTLELRIELHIGPNIGPVECRGLLNYTGDKSGTTSGELSANVMGPVQIKDIFDLSEAGDDVKLNIEEIDLELDIGAVTAESPSFIFYYGKKPSFVLSWDGMRIEVGGTKKLDLHFSVPVGDLTANLISYVHVEFIKDDPDNNGKSTKRFSTDIQVHGNLIGDGLALLGDAGDFIIEKKELTVAIEKTGRKALFLMPDDLIPDQIRFGSAENGLLLSNARGFVKPGKKLAFGAGGRLELNILGLTTVLEGELSVQRKGIVGRMGYTGEIVIGEHVKLTSLFVEFAVGQAGGETTFTLYEREGNLKLIMAMTPTAPPVPYPTSFDLTYPGELSIKGLIEAFVGEVPIPKEIGEIVVISGTPDESTLVKGDLKIEFDIVAIYFKIDCFISVLDGFFEGSVNGEFSIESGLDFHGKLKPINLVFLKIDGYNPGEVPELILVIPGISSNPQDLEVYVNAAITVLGITAGVRIQFDNGGIKFQVKGNMWNVLKAELTIYGDVSNGGGSLGIDAYFENSIIETITGNSHQFVNNLLDGALSGLNSAKDELERQQEDLKKLDVERSALIRTIQAEKEAAKKRLSAAQSVVNRAKEDVASLEKEINRQRAFVRAERDVLLKDINAAKNSLREAKRALSSIDRQIENRKRELNRKRKKLSDEIKRLENSISSAQRTVDSWLKSVRWHQHEISHFHRKISSKRRDIRNLSWWKSWKAPLYLGEIAIFYARIGTLEVGKAAVIVSRAAAIAVLSGIKSAINYSRRLLNQIPAALLDPTILYLITEREVSKVALDIALAFLSGAGAVLEWVPIDLDPRVASVIILKEGANLALTLAYESLELLKGAIDLFPPEMDPRVIALDAIKIAANVTLEVAMGILDTASAAVTGPISDALNFIATGVNGILNSIPLVINSIEFSSHLSTASGGAVELKMSYTFLGSKKSLQFMFDFSRATDVILQFAEVIGNEILGLITGGNRSLTMMESATNAEHNFSMDELKNVDSVLKNLKQDLKVEGDQATLEFEFAKVEMKTSLVEAQESMLGLRLALVDEHMHTAEEDQEILKRINTIVSDDIGTEVKMRASSLRATRSNGFSSQVDEASEDISNILTELKAGCEAERTSVQNFGAMLQATRDELKKEVEVESQDRAKLFDMHSSNTESREEVENTIKRKRIALWKKHEQSLRNVVQSDRAVKRDLVVGRTKLYEESAKNLEIMKDFSSQLIQDINSLSKNAASIAMQKNKAKSRGVSGSAEFSAMRESAGPEDILAFVLDEEDEEEKAILEQRDTMIVKVAMYQHSLEGGAESVHKKSQYDMALLQVFKMEDQLISVLDSLDDDKGRMKYSVSTSSE